MEGGENQNGWEQVASLVAEAVAAARDQDGNAEVPDGGESPLLDAKHWEKMAKNSSIALF